MSAATWRILADTVLLLHAGIVVFVLLGQALIMLGGVLNWRWVRGHWFRWTHLAVIAVVFCQALLGRVCPLTTLENHLRSHAGDVTYEGSFVTYWVHRLLFYQAPQWTFVVAYGAFFLLVLLSWWRWPPRRRGRGKPA